MKYAVAFALFAVLAAVASAEQGYPFTGVPSFLLAVATNTVPISVGGLTPGVPYQLTTTNAICKFMDTNGQYRGTISFTPAANQHSKSTTLQCLFVSGSIVTQHVSITLNDATTPSAPVPLAESDDFVVFLPSFKPIRPLDANLCSIATAIGIQGLVNITMPLTSPNGCTFYESCTLEDLANGDLVPITQIKPSGATISLYAVCDTNWHQTISIDGVASQEFIVYPPPIFENFPTEIRGGDTHVTNGFQIQGMIDTESYILEPLHGNCSIWDDARGKYSPQLLIVNPDFGYFDAVFSCDGVEARTNMKLTRLVTGTYWFTPFFNIYFDKIDTIIPTQWTGECSGMLHSTGRLGDVMRYTSDNSNCAVFTDSQCSAENRISDVADSDAPKLTGTDGLDFWIKCDYYSPAQLLYLGSVPSNYYLVLTRPVVTTPAAVRGGSPNKVTVSRIAANVQYILSDPSNNCLFWDGAEYVPQVIALLSLGTDDSGNNIEGEVGGFWYMSCAASTRTQTVKLSGPEADTFADPFRVYNPTISHIKDRFYSDECQVVTISDLVEGNIYPQDMYTTGDSDGCSFFDDGGQCVTDPELGAEAFNGFYAYTDGDDYTISMQCTPGIHRQFRTIVGTLDPSEDPFDSVNTGAVSNPFIVLQRGVNKGSICGDPYFHGLDGRGFTFNGKADHWYNVYSNPWVTINSKFISARTTKDATVNGAVGITTSHYNISVDNLDLNVDTEILNYYINGHKFHIYPGQSLQLGSGCLSISFERVTHTKIHHSLVIKTKEFTIHTYFLADHNGHVNTTYLDYFVAADQSHPSTLGGVLGFTATGDYNISYFLHHDKHFVASGPFAHDSHADTYKGESLCHTVHARAMEEDEQVTEEGEPSDEDAPVAQELVPVPEDLKMPGKKNVDVEASFVAAHKKKDNANACQYLPNGVDCKNSIMCASHFCHPTLKICLTPGPCFSGDDCTPAYPDCNDIGTVGQTNFPFMYTGCQNGDGDLLSEDDTEVNRLLDEAAAWDAAHHNKGHAKHT